MKTDPARYELQPNIAFDEPKAKGPLSPKRARLFYFGVAALLLVLMSLGFQQFYLHGKAYPNRELAPPIRTLAYSARHRHVYVDVVVPGSTAVDYDR